MKNMNVLCTCAYCGQYCYDLDAVEVRKLPDSCAGKFGEEFFIRISNIRKPVICKEHLHPDPNETTFYDKFFHDHDYLSLENPRNLESKLKTMTICMICQQNAYEKDIKMHAIQHFGYLDVRDYLCDLHNLKKKQRDYLADLSQYCDDCYSCHNTAIDFKTKRMINICFPLYVCEFRNGVKHGLVINIPQDYKDRKMEIFPSKKYRQRKEFEEMMRMIKQEDEVEEKIVKTEVKEEEMEEMEVEEWREESEEEEEEYEDDLKKDADFKLPSDAESEDNDVEEFEDSEMSEEDKLLDELSMKYLELAEEKSKEVKEYKRKIERTSGYRSTIKARQAEQLGKYSNALKEDLENLAIFRDFSEWRKEKAEKKLKNSESAEGVEDSKKWKELRNEAELFFGMRISMSGSANENQILNRSYKRIIVDMKEMVEAGQAEGSDDATQSTSQEFTPRNTRSRTNDAELFQQFFDQNAHSTCKQINEFCKENSMRFGYFERSMESWRINNKIFCEADDSCTRIRLFNELANMPLTPIEDEKMKKCEEVFLQYCEENKNFEKSDAYEFAEEFEVNPYSMIKAYQVFRKARNVKSKLKERMRKFEEENQGAQNSSLNTKHVALRLPKLKRIPKESVKKLVEEYEKEPECSMERAIQVGKRLGLDKKTVRNWFFRQKKHREGGKRNGLRHTFTEEEKVYLTAKFDVNQYPSKKEQHDMAKELRLTAGNVFYFFNSRRTEARKRKEWEIVRNDIKDLPEATIDQLIKAFNGNPNAKFDDRVKITCDLKLSYKLVTLWFEIKVLEKRKITRLTRRFSKKRKCLSDSEEDSEEEDDGENSETENQVWESLKLLVANATGNMEPERKSLRRNAGKRYFEVSDEDEHVSDEDWDAGQVAENEEDVEKLKDI